MNNENKEIREKLVRSLIKNHLRIDLKRYHDWSFLFQKDFNINTTPSRRTIAIVGSGASIVAGLPVAKDAIQHIIDELSINQKSFDRELERLASVYRLRRDEFETALLALSSDSYASEKVRETIQKMYSLRYYPILSYEILAHMLKHRYLDAIINFNFDELLDQSISDELVTGEYHYIVFDGDCPQPIRISDRLYDLPIYLKPHGTVSHKSTLRFTREAYFGLPLDIRNLISNLVSDIPVTLLVIGFNMQSFEFNQIANIAQPESEIFYINITKPNPEPELTKNYTDYFIDVSSDGLDDEMKNIWLSIKNAFCENYYPRTIKRHELISKIFSKSEVSHKNQQPNIRNDEDYLHDRTIIELAFSIAKGKGLLNMNVLSVDRCGKYYDIYKKKDNNAELLYKMCEDIGLEEIGYSREAYRIRRHNSKNDYGILNEDDFNSNLENLSQRVLSSLRNINRNNFQKNFDYFKETLKTLYRSEEVEIQAQTESLYSKVFTSPIVIYTETGLKYITEYQLKNKNWDMLFVVAETGEWLLKNNIKKILLEKEEKSLYIIVADDTYKERLENEYRNSIVTFKKMPWWEHNRHITLLLEKDIPISTIYFTRRLRSPFINPVLLLDKNNSFIILQSFIAYWRKADRSNPWLNLAKLNPNNFFKDLPRKNTRN